MRGCRSEAQERIQNMKEEVRGSESLRLSLDPNPMPLTSGDLGRAAERI